MSNPSPLPLNPNDPITGAYLSMDGTTVYRFYGNGSYACKSLIHPSVSFGTWGYFGDGRYSLYMSLVESEGKVTYPSSMFNAPLEYTLVNGILTSSGSSDRYTKISGNPDETVQGRAYPTTSANTPIDRQVGVEVKRVSSSTISVKILTGRDVASLVSLSVMANGKEAAMTGGNISPQIGSVAIYEVSDNTDIVVVAEFYDYSRYNVWAGKI